MLCSVSSNTVNLLKLGWSQWFSCCPVPRCSWPPFFFKWGHCLGAGGGVHPGQFASSPQGPTNETNKTTHSHKVRLKQPNYQLHFFYLGRKGRNWRTWKEPRSGKNTSTQTQYLLAVILNLPVKYICKNRRQTWIMTASPYLMKAIYDSSNGGGTFFCPHLHYSRVFIVAVQRLYTQ